MQSKLRSLKESFINVAVGYAVSLGSYLVIFPIMGIDMSIQENITLSAYFTVLSIGRGYLVRRIFNN